MAEEGSAASRKNLNIKNLDMKKKNVKRIKKVAKKTVKKSKRVVRKVVKKAKKRVVKKSMPKKAKAAAKAPTGKKIGAVTHFYGNISVGIVKFSKPVALGAVIRFMGATTDFSQTVDSMQFDHKEITLAPAGQEVGLKVKKKVREGDEIYEQ